jgi:hypothetical protein
MTAVANAAFTAAQFNASVRDDFLETAPAKATTAGGIFVATGANSIAQRIPTTATVSTSNTVTFTTYGDPATAGPAVTVTTGTQAIVIVTASISNGTTGGDNRVDFAVSGATTRAAADSTALIHQVAAANQAHRSSVVNLITSLTAGSNTFTSKYRITATGGGTATFNDRVITVIPL